MRLPRFIAAILALSLLAAACSDDGDDPNTIQLDENGLTPGIDDIQIEVSEGSTVGLPFATLENEPTTFDSYLGEPLVINFFAEWCPNCVHEMPDFEDVFQDVQDEVNFIGISLDQRPEDALDLIDATGVTYDIGWDPSEELFAHFRGFSYPTTVFVDAEGNVARVWSGVLNQDSLRDLIDEEIL